MALNYFLSRFFRARHFDVFSNATEAVVTETDTHDGGNRKRKPIIDVKPGWEPIHGLKTRKRKRIDDIEIAPLVVPGQPDLVAEHYARMKEEEEIILLLAA